jgi:hypothetical protein
MKKSTQRVLIQNSIDDENNTQISDSDDSNDTYTQKRPRIQCTELKNVYVQFPFQLFETDKEKITYLIENGAFHCHTCAYDGYKLKDLQTTANDRCLSRQCNDFSAYIISKEEKLRVLNY